MYAQFRHPAAGAGAASAAAGAGAAHAPWFSRDDVLRQLAALGYTVRLAHNRSFFFNFFMFVSLFHVPCALKAPNKFPKTSSVLRYIARCCTIGWAKESQERRFYCAT